VSRAQRAQRQDLTAATAQLAPCTILPNTRVLPAPMASCRTEGVLAPTVPIGMQPRSPALHAQVPQHAHVADGPASVALDQSLGRTQCLAFPAQLLLQPLWEIIASALLLDKNSTTHLMHARLSRLQSMATNETGSQRVPLPYNPSFGG